MSRPSGTVTFLFTDIEGSTRRWEMDPDEMRLALALHDEVLRSAIEAHDGWLFKHTGDGVCAAFSSASAAIDAAVQAQHSLRLPVRMGVATGEAERRGEDYFGRVLNRTARVMAAGHGGQILVAASTAAVLSGVELVDLGEHRLRDLSGVEHLHQVRVDALRTRFPPLRTLDAAPGNLPAQATSFVGRDVEVKEVADQVRAHRLVTLTGVGGVGKTRLALQVAAQLTAEFPNGVWLVELAPVGDPAAVPDAVAAVLGVTPHADLSVADSIAQALSGRRLLLVMDNCEHVLDAAADLFETILARSATVTVLATSREGLRMRAEHLWSVPSLDVAAGAGSTAVALFVERARAAVADFDMHDEVDTAAVTEICRRLDGIALAIELAAARMVSMSPSEVLERLTDRFLLLSGSRRGLERHQTLRQAVQWSYDLLADDEATVLGCCSVFAGGFDVATATAICDRFGEYEILDLLDALVRKSLVTAERLNGHTRYGLLETVRQFAEERLADVGSIGETRDRHAAYFAEQAVVHWELWDGPRYRAAVDWGDVEVSNLRAAFRWAADHDDPATATAVAAHTALLNWALQRFEAAGWAEELLEAATSADVRYLPRLFTASSLCMFTGRADAAVGYAETAVALATEPRYDAIEPGLSGILEGTSHTFSGRIDRCLEIVGALAVQAGSARVAGLCGTLYTLPAVGRIEEATAMAEETLAAARGRGNPFYVAFALAGYGRTFAATDPARALTALRDGLAIAREHRIPIWEAIIAPDAAQLEAAHGELGYALGLFDASLESQHRAGNLANSATTLISLAVLFDRIEQPEVAATIYGACTHHASISFDIYLSDVLTHLRSALGDAPFDECVSVGAAMEPADAVGYAHDHIQQARRRLAPDVMLGPSP